jgi:hypothetical protein
MKMNNMTRPKQIQRPGPAADMATALLTNFEASSRSFLDWNAEVARFVNARMMRDAETVQAAMGCGNGLKLAEIQRAWMSQTVEDYLQETQRLMEMSSGIVTGLVASLGQAAPVATSEVS